MKGSSLFILHLPMTNDNFDIHEEQHFSPVEKDYENALRPLNFGDFSGQNKVVENLQVFVEAAKYRGEPLDHTLLHGPPGLGKTTLSNPFIFSYSFENLSYVGAFFKNCSRFSSVQLSAKLLNKPFERRLIM